MNNYQQQYEQLIAFRQHIQPLNRILFKCHRHHIKPKSIFPELEFEQSNIVILTIQEHIEAHRLIMLWYRDEYGVFSQQYEKMTYAYYRLLGKYDKTSTEYTTIRKTLNVMTSIRNSNSIWINDGHNEFFILKDKLNQYPDFKIGRIAKPNSGKIIVNNGKENRFVYPDAIPDGFVIGSIMSSTKGQTWITNGHMQTLIDKDKELPDGWHYGMCKGSPCAGSIWINNGKIMKRIKCDPKSIPNGWVHGKLPSKSKGQLIYVNNGIDTIKVRPDEIPEGYVKGCLCCSKNCKLINNGKIQKYIKIGDPLPDGFVYGTIKHSRS